MDRRRFLLTSTAGAFVVPLAAETQQRARSLEEAFWRSAWRRIAICTMPSGKDCGNLGYVEGRNLVIEYRDAEGKLERLPLWQPNWLPSRLM